MGATSIYMATVAVYGPFVVRNQRHRQSQRPGPDLRGEFLAWRHLGVTPLFMAVQKAATDAPNPTM